jgi:hypothetical protein
MRHFHKLSVSVRRSGKFFGEEVKVDGKGIVELQSLSS